MRGLAVHATHPLDDLSTPALKRSWAVHRYTDARMRCPCPEGAASTVDFYVILIFFKERGVGDLAVPAMP